MLAWGNRRFLYPAAAVFVLIIFYYSRSYPTVWPTQHYLSGQEGSFDGIWNFERDAKNLLLSDAQCDAAFPGLFKEVDRAVEQRRKNYITINEINEIKRDNGYVRGMIYDQQVSALIPRLDSDNYSSPLALYHRPERHLLLPRICNHPSHPPRCSHIPRIPPKHRIHVPH